MFFIIIVWVIKYWSNKKSDFVPEFFIYFWACLWFKRYKLSSNINFHYFDLYSSIIFYTIVCLVAKTFQPPILNAVNKNIFALLFIYSDLIWINTFHIDHVIHKIVCAIYYIYFLSPFHYTSITVILYKMLLFWSAFYVVTVNNNDMILIIPY